MAETPTKPKAWTDTEKVALIFQILERAGPIPWDTIKLPEGRTKKACEVMLDREKQKIKKAREAAGEVVEPTPKGKGKRKGEGEAEDSPAGGAKKKAKGRKKAAEQEANNDDGEEGVVKAEPEGDVSE